MKKLWQANSDFIKNSNLKKFMEWINAKHSISFNSYDELWLWSVNNLDNFWIGILEFYDISYTGNYNKVLSNASEIINSKWFLGIQVNYSEHIFKNKKNEEIAIHFINELGEKKSYTWLELKLETVKLAEYFKANGVIAGDRIAGFLPNIPEALIAFLACNSIGAIWSTCSPDFGTKSVVDRFQQIEPKIVLLANAYSYNGKLFDKNLQNHELINELPSVQKVISITYINSIPDFKHNKSINWQEIPKTNSELSFERVNFNDPIWILYSSGTTGKPKAITHSVGGILLEHYKALGLHQNVKKDEVYFWFSTTGWMMWNYANAALLLGAKLFIYEGSPNYPNLNKLWDLAATLKINHFGAGAGFYISCMKDELKIPDLPHLKSIGSTGSPLPPEAFQWIYKAVKSDVWLISLSGGTDICSAFVGGNPFDPVYEGEIQCRLLGVDLHAYDESGNKVINELGEMVIDSPMPSMPIYFWNDKNNQKYRESYFIEYPGKWRHGDWIKISKYGSIIIFGRSDSTLNRGGVRIGTSEVYSAVESVPEVKDSLVVCLDLEGGKQFMPLFVVLQNEQGLNEDIKTKIKTQLKTLYSPRHVPDVIVQIQEVPYTISGKKMETPIKKILMGIPIEKSASKDAMKNPNSILFFENYYQNL